MTARFPVLDAKLPIENIDWTYEAIGEITRVSGSFGESKTWSMGYKDEPMIIRGDGYRESNAHYAVHSAIVKALGFTL